MSPGTDHNGTPRRRPPRRRLIDVFRERGFPCAPPTAEQRERIAWIFPERARAPHRTGRTTRSGRGSGATPASPPSSLRSSASSNAGSSRAAGDDGDPEPPSSSATLPAPAPEACALADGFADLIIQLLKSGALLPGAHLPSCGLQTLGAQPKPTSPCAFEVK